jgi:integrase
VKLKYLQQKGGAYYFVRTNPDGTRPWVPLGSDLKIALEKYAKLLKKQRPEAGTVASVLQDYFDTLAGRVKDSSVTTYGYYMQNLVRVLGSIEADELTPQQVAKYIITSKRRAAKDEVRFLAAAYGHAILTNAAITVNPALGMKVKSNVAAKVKRYVSDAELELILKHSKRPMLALAVEIAYATALRVSDVLKLKWNDFGDEAAIIQTKTGTSAPRQRYEVTPEIADLVSRAMALQGQIKSMFVISGRGGRPIKYKRFWEWFNEARDAAGLEDVVFHDIRRKAATDRYNQTGGDIVAVQKLLGHQKPDTSQGYLTGVKVNTVTPMKRRKA